MGETTTVRRNSQTKDTFRRFIKKQSGCCPASSSLAC